VVESGSLENCCTLTGTVGSNPTLSAIISTLFFFTFPSSSLSSFRSDPAKPSVPYGLSELKCA
jgi:hypothetical protein